MRQLTYLDLFPYNPHYNFNGFRSTFGTALSILFLFALFLRVVTTIDDFVNSNPIIYNKPASVAHFKETQPIDVLGAKLILDGGVLNNERVARIFFEQADVSAGRGIQYTDLGVSTKSIQDPNDYIQYTNVDMPAVTGRMYGDFNLERFGFVRVRVEQCLNTTTFDEIKKEYVVNGSTTAGARPCHSLDYIEDILSRAVVQVFFGERVLDPDSFYHTTSYLVMNQRRFLSNSLLTHQFFFEVQHIYFVSRYIFDKFSKHEQYLTLGREDSALSDATTVIGTDRLRHLNRMNFIFRLDRRYIRQTRDHHPIYGMFESWAASAVFFIGVFGSVGWLINRRLFQRQTRGLDIRKMDKDQFDKFGRLVDKSFQMPRELQDMQAE